MLFISSHRIFIKQVLEYQNIYYNTMWNSTFQIKSRYNDKKTTTYCYTIHSLQIRGLCSTKCSSEKLQNLLYFMYKKPHFAGTFRWAQTSYFWKVQWVLFLRSYNLLFSVIPIHCITILYFVCNVLFIFVMQNKHDKIHKNIVCGYIFEFIF